MSQSGVIIVETHITMDHSHTLLLKKQVIILLLRKMYSFEDQTKYETKWGYNSGNSYNNGPSHTLLSEKQAHI